MYCSRGYLLNSLELYSDIRYSTVILRVPKQIRSPWPWNPFAAYAKSNLEVVMANPDIPHQMGYCNNILGTKGVAVPWK